MRQGHGVTALGE